MSNYTRFGEFSWNLRLLTYIIPRTCMKTHNPLRLCFGQEQDGEVGGALDETRFIRQPQINFTLQENHHLTHVLVLCFMDNILTQLGLHFDSFSTRCRSTRSCCFRRQRDTFQWKISIERQKPLQEGCTTLVLLGWQGDRMYRKNHRKAAPGQDALDLQ